jgi:hypothetical protein
MMTIREAMEAKIRIKPGRKVKTFGGWCRRDSVLLAGHEIGRIQTRRGRGRMEVLTISGNVFVMGHDVDWLVSSVVGRIGGANGCNAASAAGL